MTIQRFYRWIGFSFAVLLLMSSQAHAQTVGAVIDDLSSSFETLPGFFSMIAYIMGCFYAVIGIFKFKDHVDNPSQTPISAGIKRFFAGGMLLALPFMAGVTKRMLFGAPAVVLVVDSGHNPAIVGGGMEQMIYDLIVDIAGPMEMLLTSFSYIAGVILLIVVISRMIKTAQDGPRGPTGLGTIVTLLVAGILISGAGMISAFTTILFGDATTSTFATINPAIIANPADAARIGAVIECVMAFIMIVGIIAFLRGLFVLRAFAEGSQSATIIQALTFIFGGVLAINLGDLVNVLQTTVGVVGVTFT